VRYLAAIERAYTRALRADAGYAGLVQHNPFSPSYETFSGRDEPAPKRGPRRQARTL
jgi:Replicase family